MWLTLVLSQWVEVGRDLCYLCYFSAPQAESSQFWGVVTGRYLCLGVVQLYQELLWL